MRSEKKAIIEEIKKTKKLFGDKLVILGHYYQSKDILDLTDIQGDSFYLAKEAANLENAKHIVFCGVHFMAECADILSKPNQTVQIPDQKAGCPMADMASLDEVKTAWKTITSVIDETSITPITYMNSTAEIKSFCGEHNGSVCTSSNAHLIFNWARQKNNIIFFFPDEHLGRNSAEKLGLDEKNILVWDPKAPLKKLTGQSLKNINVILWKGCCNVHTFFTEEHITAIRHSHPDAVIIAHPECKKEVIDLVDYSGSTAFIDKFIKQATIGSITAIATETTMVNRLANEYPDKKIIPVAHSFCADMEKITLEKLKYTLDHLGEYNIIKVNEKVKKNARKALVAMLKIVDGN